MHASFSPESTLRQWLVVLLATCSPVQAAAPAPEVGTPFIASFIDQDYGAHSQNWAVVQDDRGVMYFGNGNGVLVFDGVEWRTIQVANSSIVRSLDVDSAGTVFVGAVNELGYLRSDAAGTSIYVSLLNELVEEDRNPGDIWRVYATDNGIFFWATHKLFRWLDGSFESWEIHGRLICCRVDDRIFYNQEGAGLRVLEGDEFLALKGTEVLGGVKVMTMLPYRDGQLLIASRDGRLWLLSWTEDPASSDLLGNLERFQTAVDSVLARHEIYGGIRLANGSLAFATITGGSFVISPRGELLHRFDKSNGLSDQSVWALYEDREQGLWHAMNRGLARVELGTPVTIFDGMAGLEGTVEAIARFQGALHVATSVGLYRLEEGRFRYITGAGAPFWSLLDHDVPGSDRHVLLVGSSLGTFELQDGELKPVMSVRNAFQLYRSRQRPGSVFVGAMEGFGVLTWVDGDWVTTGLLEGIDQEVRSVFEDDEGQLWLGTHFDGVMRLTLGSGPKPKIAELQRFGVEHGLPSLRSVKIQDHFGQILFASTDGLFSFDPEARAFSRSASLDSEHDTMAILRSAADLNGNVWLSSHRGELGTAFRQADGSYAVDMYGLKRLASPATYAILPEADGVVWFGGVHGLFRFKPTFEETDDQRFSDRASFSTWIRKVSVAQPGGAVLYGGSRAPSWAAPILPYATSSLRFEYALPRFDGREANRYRSRLIGLGEAWSDWTDETYRDFTSLSEGHYRLEVEGRDVFHQPSDVATFSFRILPPWYRTWWAYALYSLFLFSMTGGLLTWQLRRVRLKMEVQRLAEANAMMRRTEEERQRFVRELEAKNREMERFIYTVSHDLKSPLISIRGFLGMLEQDMSAGKQGRMRHDMQRIHAATGKMADLVDELLELSKIGKQTHEPERVAMDDLAREAVEQIAGLIAERRAEVIISPEMPPVKGDRRRLQAMFQNLIENGVKYMGEQPKPKIEINHRQVGDETVYRVRDNGIGIAPRYQDKIFGLFERLSTEIEGTGVGLALVKRIVEVHGGRIWVESEGEGMGSTFCFTLSKTGLGVA